MFFLQIMNFIKWIFLTHRHSKIMESVKIMTGCIIIIIALINLQIPSKPDLFTNNWHEDKINPKVLRQMPSPQKDWLVKIQEKIWHEQKQYFNKMRF